MCNSCGCADEEFVELQLEEKEPTPIVMTLPPAKVTKK